MDLQSLSFPELQGILGNIHKELKSRQKTSIVEARKEVAEVARRHGVSIEDILSAKVSKEPVQPKYADPDTGETEPQCGL
mgnify:CR=1 FL=1